MEKFFALHRAIGVRNNTIFLEINKIENVKYLVILRNYLEHNY